MKKISHLLLLFLCSLFLYADTGSPDKIHKPWNKLLYQHVDKKGLVDYKGFKKDKDKLNKYLNSLAEMQIDSTNREFLLELWINAYNAYTVKLIIDNYPVKSIRDINNPWKTPDWKVSGKNYSLDQMEHEQLRGLLKEPRIHFAIVCASIGCPNLWNRAYTAKNIEEELSNSAKKFMTDPRHIYAKEEKNLLNIEKVLYVSKIFKWFNDDFTEEGNKPLTDFIIKYADKATINFIEKAGKDLKIKYLNYDWNLNEKN